MKWGVHKAIGIQNRKIRLMKKSSKQSMKAAKLTRKANKAMSKGNMDAYTKYSKLSYKKLKSSSSIQKKLIRGEKYVNKMKKKISKIPKEELDSGYEFCKKLLTM